MTDFSVTADNLNFLPATGLQHSTDRRLHLIVSPAVFWLAKNSGYSAATLCPKAVNQTQVYPTNSMSCMINFFSPLLVEDSLIIFLFFLNLRLRNWSFSIKIISSQPKKSSKKGETKYNSLDRAKVK